MSSGNDAVLLVSFGGPERPEDIEPFLQHVAHGRRIPESRLKEVAAQYHRVGGRSPINDHNRRLLQQLGVLLQAEGPALPLYWGNRHWHPFLKETVKEMMQDGIQHALAFVTSPYSSYSSCRQYLNAIAQAQAEAGEHAPQITKLRAYYNHPRFIQAIVERAQVALTKLRNQGQPKSVHVIFTAHSIPLTMASQSDYVVQLHEVAALVAEQLQQPQWQLAYQSRSGYSSQPWLEPDINEALKACHTQGLNHALVVPIGFISDHMEVVHDLDYVAFSTARALGMHVERASTVGDHPEFVAMIRELILEHTQHLAPRAVGRFGPRPDVCLSTCCPSG